MSDAILELEHLSKRYGDHLAVDDLSFAVPRGAVYGLLGPNGAGKSTTIRMIMRIISSDAGSIRLDGEPVDDDRRRLIGYLPEERGLYRKMKVLEHLAYLGTIRGVRPGEAKKRSAAGSTSSASADWATHKVEDLSKGMQQKVQFIGTVLHRPRLLILDEPFSGLDPINTRELKDLLLAMSAGRGDGRALDPRAAAGRRAVHPHLPDQPRPGDPRGAAGARSGPTTAATSGGSTPTSGLRRSPSFPTSPR